MRKVGTESRGMDKRLITAHLFCDYTQTPAASRFKFVRSSGYTQKSVTRVGYSV